MTSWNPVEVYANDHELAIAHLSRALYHGELALLLGAGASREFGFPGWLELVRRCLAMDGQDPASVKDDASFEQITETVGKLRDKLGDELKYHAMVKEALYRAAADRDTSTPTPLLRAIGALLMGSRRGKIREVWTLNYDDILEWHLRIHGFVSQVVTEVPCLLREVDVLAYHPHGFLPLDTSVYKDSKRIVFDDKAYAKRFVGDDPWRGALDYALKTKVFLAIGLSWGDLALKALITNAAEINSSRPTAFWFFGGTSPEVANASQHCLRHNVVPLCLPSHSDYSPFLLRICKTSMDTVKG